MMRSTFGNWRCLREDLEGQTARITGQANPVLVPLQPGMGVTRLIPGYLNLAQMNQLLFGHGPGKYPKLNINDLLADNIPGTYPLVEILSQILAMLEQMAVEFTGLPARVAQMEGNYDFFLGAIEHLKRVKKDIEGQEVENGKFSVWERFFDAPDVAVSKQILHFLRVDLELCYRELAAYLGPEVSNLREVDPDRLPGTAMAIIRGLKSVRGAEIKADAIKLMNMYESLYSLFNELGLKITEAHGLDSDFIGKFSAVPREIPEELQQLFG